MVHYSMVTDVLRLNFAWHLDAGMCHFHSPPMSTYAHFTLKSRTACSHS